MFKRVVLALLLSLAALRGQAALPFGLPSSPQNPVTDQVGLLSTAQAQQLNQALRAVWQSGAGPQVAVLIVKNLEGRPIEDQSLTVARGWALGDRDRDDGVLLLIARDDRKLRIEVGTKFEGQLTDVVSHRIIADVMVPRLRQGDAGGAVEAGVAHILSHVAPDSARALPMPSAGRGPRVVKELSAAQIAMLLGVIALMVVAQMMGFPIISILLQILLSSGGRSSGGGGSGGFGGGGGGFSGGGSSGSW